MGDTVQLVDFALYQKECLKAKEKINQEYEKLQETATEDGDSEGSTVGNGEDRTSVRQEYAEYKKIKDKLIAEDTTRLTRSKVFWILAHRYLVRLQTVRSICARMIISI